MKITGELKPNTEHSFLGRKWRHNGDSIDIRMPKQYIDNLLELYSMDKVKNPVNTTGSASLKRIEDADVSLDAKAHSLFRTAVGKLLWLAFVRPDCSYAVKELSRDVKSPTFESLASKYRVYTNDFPSAHAKACCCIFSRCEPLIRGFVLTAQAAQSEWSLGPE